MLPVVSHTFRKQSAAGLCCLSLLIASWHGGRFVLAQDQPATQSAPAGSVPGPSGKPDTSRPPVGKTSRGAPSDSGKQAGEARPDANKSKENEKTDEQKKEKSSPAVITRPRQPEHPGDPAQLQTQVDAAGRVRFNFSGQKWPDILEWLAQASHLSLDWQELPGDYLNLRTQRDYSVAEAQDLINRHLLARGFTLLKSGEVLTVVNISKLNPSLVPRVEPAGLSDCMDHEFVKVSFPLDWMLAERAVEELKPMLSANGKLTALKSVNRIEAMDAAVNLKEIHRLLEQEQRDDATKGSVVREFKLQHRRAGEVLLLLEAILGLDKNRPPASSPGRGGDMMSMQILQQVQQMQQMMQQQQRGGASAAAGGNHQADEPKLIVNERENSILVHAPPDKLEIIAQTIQAIDVPGDQQNTLLQNLNRIRSYMLSTLDPQPLMLILNEMGDLSPQCRLQVDQKSHSLIVYGTLADHYTVQALIERLDGSNRTFEVIPLRRVQADAIAGTIQYMMGSEDPNKARNNSRGSFGYFFTPPSQNENEDKRPFKVDADIENNRLLVWANPVEMQEIRQLLIKMGETPPGMSNPETVRTLQLDSDAEADRLLQRLQQVWPEIHSNPLRIQAPTPALPRKSSPPRDVTPPTTHIPAQPASPAAKLTVRYAWWQNGQDPVSSGLHPLAEETSTATDPERGADAGGHLPEDSSRRSADTGGVLPSGSAPIAIERSPMGGLILGSSDTAALDRLEEMIEQLAPPSRDYKVFQLRYPNTWAYGVELNLKAFFKDTSSEQQVRDPFWGYSYTVRNNEGRRMSRQKELKIISDDDSHTILVQGATPQQLLTIADLIEIYDRPTSSDPSAVRHTRIIRLKYSQAEAMAETVKQVYRDLLSANDPALRDPNPNNGKEKAVTERIYSYRMSDEGEGNSSTPPQQPMKFKGMLSVGVDEISNSVAISAGQSLLQEIEEMITLLDEAANPHTHVQVMQVQNLDTTALKERLDKTFTPSVKVSETGRRRNRQSVPQPPPAAPVRNDD